MFKLYETLAPSRQLEFAVRAKSPIQLAETFAAFVGQFNDRGEFDALARRVRDLYDGGRASTFRSRLDRRLYDRFHAPVVWHVGEVVPPAADRAA